MISREVPASSKELALIDELRAACDREDRARVDALMKQIRAVQKARLYEMTTNERGE